MKILITTDWYRPTVNGVVTSVLTLEKQLTELGHDVRILTLSRGRRATRKDNVYYLPSLKAEMFYPGARLGVPFLYGILRELVAWKPDVIHSQCEFSTFLFASGIASNTGAAIVHTYHTIYEDYTHYFSPNKAWGRKAVELFSKKICNHADQVIVPTEKVKTILDQYGVTTRINVIPSGIELNRFRHKFDSGRLAEERKRLGIPENDRLLVFVGRLAKEKNCEELLTFFDRAGRKDCSLLLVGDGPYRKELTSMAARLKNGNKIFFAGMVLPEQVSFYYKMGDLFVCASGSETQGITYVEALASGLPAVCRRDKCIEQVVIPDVSGFQYDDFDGFSAALEKILSDRSYYDRLSAGAERTALSFDAGCFGKAVLKCYQEAIRMKTVTVVEWETCDPMLFREGYCSLNSVQLQKRKTDCLFLK